MNKNYPTTEDDLQEEYDLKNLKVRKLGSERKIFNSITTLFRRPRNDSLQKAQKIEHKILDNINNPGIVCKVLFDKDDNVEITFELKTTNQAIVQDIHLYKALNIARKNTKENQDINVFVKEKSGYRYPIFLLKKEMDICDSIENTLSYLGEENLNHKRSFNRKKVIDALRGRQAAKQLVYTHKKEDLQQHKLVSEKRSHNVSQSLKSNSFILIIAGILFVGYPGLIDSSIMSKFFDFSVNYKTCKIIGKDGKDTNKIDKSCKRGKSIYQLIFLLFLFKEADLAYKNYRAKVNVLVINHALDVLSNELKESDGLQQ
jgi:arsenate reductase-like glutaredoxin family protein